MATTLTESEQKVVDMIKQILNDGIEIIYPHDLEYYGAGDMNQLRGTLASLVKKNVIYIDSESNNLISLLKFK